MKDPKDVPIKVNQASYIRTLNSKCLTWLGQRFLGKKALRNCSECINTFFRRRKTSDLSVQVLSLLEIYILLSFSGYQ